MTNKRQPVIDERIRMPDLIRETGTGSPINPIAIK